MLTLRLPPQGLTRQLAICAKARLQRCSAAQGCGRKRGVIFLLCRVKEKTQAAKIGFGALHNAERARATVVLPFFAVAQSATGRELKLSLRLLRSTRSISETAQSEHRSTGMGLFSKDIKSMEDLFLHTLQDVYYAENQIVKSLPKMIDKATNRELASGLRSHLAETEQQVIRLEQVFEGLGREPRGTDCPAIDGLIKEADNVAGEVDDKKVLDAAIIGSAQAIEHYEISRYGTLIAWAEELGHDKIIRLLNANLKEEKAADKKLNTLAEAKLNRKATSTRVAAARVAVKKRTGKATRKKPVAKKK
jgi:ferritin-like metal-binding protein YciE